MPKLGAEQMHSGYEEYKQDAEREINSRRVKLDMNKFEYENPEEEHRYKNKNQRFAERINEGEPFTVTFTSPHLINGVREQQYYALVTLNTGDVMPYPIFANAADMPEFLEEKVNAYEEKLKEALDNAPLYTDEHRKQGLGFFIRNGEERLYPYIGEEPIGSLEEFAQYLKEQCGDQFVAVVYPSYEESDSKNEQGEYQSAQDNTKRNAIEISSGAARKDMTEKDLEELKNHEYVIKI